MKSLTLVLLFIASIAHGGLFDDPKNLKVMDDDIDAKSLRDGMKYFTFALGVRCSHCHVGEEGKPLDTFDFASDDNNNKEITRQMMRMVSKINRNYIDKIPESSVKVECASCHRGNHSPKLTVDVLVSAFNEGGVDETLKQYHALKDRYYGSHSHDFSEGMLIAVAKRVGQTDKESSLQIILENLKAFPEGSFTLFKLGSAYQELNKKQQAIKYYQKLYELKPNPRLQKIIENLTLNKMQD